MIFHLFVWQGFPGGLVVKNLSDNEGDPGDVDSISGSERSPGKGNGNPHFITKFRTKYLSV